MNLKYMPLTVSKLEEFNRDGFVILRGLFDSQEIELLQCAAKKDRVLDQNSFGRNDASGGSIRLSPWSDPGDNLYGMFARCESLKLPPDERKVYTGIGSPLLWCIIVNLMVLYFCFRRP